MIKEKYVYSKMNIKNIIKLFFVLFIGIVGCSKEFDFGKNQNSVETLTHDNLAQTSVSVTGRIIRDNGSPISTRGICYATTDNPTIANLKVNFNTAALGVYTCNLSDLAPNTTYFARAFATNSYGTAYGATLTFKTLPATLPIISSTTSASLITSTSARAGGTIISSGASNITSRGTCYSSTNKMPTITDPKTNDGTGVGSFASNLNGLTVNTTYFIRAYATNAVGTAYGDVKTFTTSTLTIPLEVITVVASSITQNSASSGGNIGADGGSPISSRGVCWSNTNNNPTISNSRTLNGTGVGSFSSLLSNLLPGTRYHLRAYATNGVGTAYGNVISFTTEPPTAPIGVSTSNLTSITQNSAIGGGNITGS
jgi:hypothetical protein